MGGREGEALKRTSPEGTGTGRSGRCAEVLQTGERLLSRYDLECGSFYIVTEANRSTTTVMGVEEY